MTLSDPLLRELKGHIIGLLSQTDGRIDYNGKSFGDENESIFLLCHCLESIFLKGLVRYDGFTPWKSDCFQWFYQVVRKYQKVIPLVFRSSFEEVLSDKKTKSHVGKTRLLIRTCLRRKCLHIPLELHVQNKDFDDQTLRVTYKAESSILGHEILSQIFLSLLIQLSNLEFRLDLSNSAFLDESWQIPAVVKVEMVPCRKLGLTLGFPLGFPVIVSVVENSAAAELSDRIEIGDILDEINGISLRNFFGAKIETIFKKCRSEPFHITIIKGRDPKSGQVYLPVIKLYRILGINPPEADFSGPRRPMQHLQESKCALIRKDGDSEAPLLNLNPENEKDCSNMSVNCPDLLKHDDSFVSPGEVQGCEFFDGRSNAEDNIPSLDICEHEGREQGEAVSSNVEQRQISIDKFYGEDGDHFIV